MRRIVVAAMSTISGLVLLFSYHTSTNRAADSEAISAQSESAVEDSQAADDSAATDESGDDEESSEKLAAGTYTGASVNTDYGDVQVRITVKKGKITKSTAVAYPTSTPRSVSLSDKAVPALAKEAVKAQSAEIDFYTGATSTSTGYAKSLQSAIDKAFA